jgi:hypothetical protein
MDPFFWISPAQGCRLGPLLFAKSPKSAIQLVHLEVSSVSGLQSSVVRRSSQKSIRCSHTMIRNRHLILICSSAHVC